MASNPERERLVDATARLRNYARAYERYHASEGEAAACDKVERLENELLAALLRGPSEQPKIATECPHCVMHWVSDVYDLGDGRIGAILHHAGKRWKFTAWPEGTGPSEQEAPPDDSGQWVMLRRESGGRFADTTGQYWICEAQPQATKPEARDRMRQVLETFYEVYGGAFDPCPDIDAWADQVLAAIRAPSESQPASPAADTEHTDSQSGGSDG